jgi:tRNA pseudouridine32 synthase/23S rRNA pseudouridine746 synthase/23S rRNA pseudouridine1911/1915/1917 synthase
VESPIVLLDFLEQLIPGATRTTLRQMLRSDRVRVNSAVEHDAKRELVPGDVVDVGEKGSAHLLPRELSIVYEDEDLVVVNKAAGLLTVSTASEKDHTVQAWLNVYLKQKGIGSRIHVVHRLDRDTSGVLVFAKTFAVREKLKELFAAHDIERVYVAIVEGVLRSEEGSFRSHLIEDEETYQVRSTLSTTKGKLAVTHYKTLKRNASYSMVEVTLETGRKNQIRVHFSEAGHPVAGDRRYGATSDPIGRVALHARLLGFRHPTSGKQMTFEAPLPDAFRKLPAESKKPA